MISPPQTREEAEKTWIGFKEFLCSHEIKKPVMWGNGDTGIVRHQCSRKPGHGPGGLYCKQHAKAVEGRQ